jgi:hypothetical protein
MTTALTLALVLVMGWFAAGSVWNVRKGGATLRWLQGGLPLLGEKTTVRWLGTTSVELVLAKVRTPFQKVTLVIFLEPRDVPWIWALSRGRGRRDSLIVRMETRQAPPHDLEVLDRASWSGREALRGIDSEDWAVREPAARGDLPVFMKVEDALPRADALLKLARDAGMTVRRLSVRRREPHLQLHVDLPASPTPAAEFFRALREIGEQATLP